jgi:peptide-methionine (S)-S-oxide reductase
MLAAWHAKRYHILAAVVIFGAACVYFFYHLENRGMPYEPKNISPNCELATLGGGCFWCLEAAFELVNGVERVESGYCGGTAKNPTYHEVCGETTGHAEVVQIAFDPKVISYHEILEIFFAIHDPTTLNYQGRDVGTRYRSVIFHHSPEQKQTAEKLIAEFKEQKLWGRPIVTQVQPLDVFYRAEDYHQGYFRANPGQGYCQLVVGPKVAKVRQHFAGKLKKM